MAGSSQVAPNVITVFDVNKCPNELWEYMKY